MDDEEEFEKGNGKLLRDFATYKELYQHKIQNQEQMSKELRRKQKSLRENAGMHAEQHKMFINLKRLLNVKLNAKHQQSKNARSPSSGGALYTNDAYGMGSDGIGGANIMTIEQMSA